MSVAAKIRERLEGLHNAADAALSGSSEQVRYMGQVSALGWALELIEAQEKTERVNREWLQQQYTEHVQLITTLGTQLEAAEEREAWVPVVKGLPTKPGTYEFLAHELNIHAYDLEAAGYFVLAGLGERFVAYELLERYSHYRPVTLPVAPRHPDGEGIWLLWRNE